MFCWQKEQVVVCAERDADETQNDSAGNGETLQGPLKTRYALEYKFKCAAEVKVVEKPSRIRKIVKVTKGTC